jgi:hypothetical protein
VTTRTILSFSHDYKRPKWDAGDLVVFNTNNMSLVPDKSFVVMVSETTFSEQFSGTVVWVAEEAKKTHHLGKFQSCWGKQAFEPFRGKLTLDSE